MIDLLKLIKLPNSPVSTTFDTDDSFVLVVNGQVVLMTKADSNIPFMVGGKVPSQYLPSYIDEVLEYPTAGDFPATGDSSKLYVALDEPTKIYRWGGTAYHVVGGYLELGETSTTAYRGDRGKIAYDFSQGHEVTTEGALDTVANGYFYPQTTLTVNSQSLLWGMTFGNTSYEGQVIFCDGGLIYVRYKDGGASYGDWQIVGGTTLYYTTGNKAIECTSDNIVFYLDDGSTIRMEMTDSDTFIYTVDGETAIQIEADRMDLGSSVAGFVGIGIQKVDSLELIDFTDKTKKIIFDVSGVSTATTRTIAFPDASGTIALQSYVVDYVNTAIGAGLEQYVSTAISVTLQADQKNVEVTGAATITLPTAVGVQGKKYVIKNTHTAAITVDTTSSQTIDGALTKTLETYESLEVLSNGVNWIITNAYITQI